MSYQATAPIVVHRSDQDFYYMDAGPILKGRTISTIDGVTASPSGGITISGSAVLTVATSVEITEGNSHLIEANTGLKFKMIGMAANTTYIVTAIFTLSDAGKLALDGILKTG